MLERQEQHGNGRRRCRSQGRLGQRGHRLDNCLHRGWGLRVRAHAGDRAADLRVTLRAGAGAAIPEECFLSTDEVLIVVGQFLVAARHVSTGRP